MKTAVSISTIFLLAFLSRPAALGQPTPTFLVEGFDSIRTDGEWGLLEEYLDETRAYILDPGSFGPDGVVPANFVLGNGVRTVTLDNLCGVDVFFTGWVSTFSYTEEEKEALMDFVLAGGTIIATTDDLDHDVTDVFGVFHGGHRAVGLLVNTISDPAHPIANGPFGSVQQFHQHLNCGHYSFLGANATEVGGNPDGASLAVIEADVLGPGSGRVILVADVDVFSDGPGYPDGGAEFNEVLIKNLFSYAIDRPAQRCGLGTVNLGVSPTPSNVLSINGEAGCRRRTVTLPVGTPIEIFMNASPAGPVPSIFALYAWLGRPDETASAPQPLQLGNMCLPTFLSVGVPKPRKIWNNAGHAPLLGVPDFPSEPAPSVVITLSNGASVAVVATFQGFIADNGSAAEVLGSITNAVILEVVE